MPIQLLCPMNLLAEPSSPGALIITNTVLGASKYKYSMMGPKTLF